MRKHRLRLSDLGWLIMWAYVRLTYSFKPKIIGNSMKRSKFQCAARGCEGCTVCVPPYLPFHLVFVYGTLKSGYGNNRLLSTSKLLGEDTLDKHDIYAVAGFPGVIPGEGIVQGEVWEITPEVLETLDRLEGHPRMYLRTPVVLSSGLEVETYIWQYEVEGKTNLEGVWP